MYRIIGADGNEYGPVSADQMRQWLAENRVNAQTQTLAEGSTDWKPLGSFPEFSGALGVVANPAPAVLASAAPACSTSSLAVGALVCGLLSWTLCLCCCYGFPANLVGIVLGISGLAQIERNPGRYQGRGMAIAGLVLCVLSLLLAAALVIWGTAFDTTWRPLRHIHRL